MEKNTNCLCELLFFTLSGLIIITVLYDMKQNLNNMEKKKERKENILGISEDSSSAGNG